MTSLLPSDCYWDYFVGEEAARFVREYDQERPFALMVGFPGPHDPYDPTAEWLEKIDASTIPPAAPGAPQIHGAQRNDGPPADQSRKPVPDRPVWVPSYMDSQPLPGLGLAGESANDMLVGFLQGAWMAFDGRYKLCKYASGFQALFDLENDLQEQHDLSQSAAHADRYRRLDTALWRDVMRSAQGGHYYNTVDGHNGLWADKEYGRRGQQRPYPVPLGTDPTRPI